MNDTNPIIKCKKCATKFEPDMKTSKSWFCPACQTNNPNLKRHYRSVADLYIIGLIFTLIGIILKLSKVGLTIDVILMTGHAILLLVTIVTVYKSRTPWTNNTVKLLICTVFGIVMLLNVVLPLVLFGFLNFPAIVVYTIVFWYLYWLHIQTNKCTAS